jgi:hypothetical protein
MSTFRNTVTNEIRDIPAALIAAWQAAGNPKATLWESYTLPDPDPEPTVPRWVQFGVALGSTPAVNVFVATLAQAAPVLHLMIGVGLGQASQGDPQTFLGGWAQCRTAGLVSAELLAGVVAMAAAYDLPGEFIAALSTDP